LQLTSSFIGKLCFALGITSLSLAVGCGNGGSLVLPHTTGNYSDSSLNGSYVYDLHGFLLDNESYREIGVFTTDGAGHITAGNDVFSSSFSGGAITNSSNLTGSYSVFRDGTGTITLNGTGLGAFAQSSQINLAITLASTSRAALMEIDAFAAGAGKAELQDTSVAGTAPNGTFVFRLHAETDPQTLTSASSVGVISIANGTVTGGSEDRNRLTTGTSSVSLTSGTFNSSTGVASLTDSANFTGNFFYFMVNSGKFVFISSDTGAVASGSAEAQSGALANGLSGTYVFGSRGEDSFFPADLASAGQFTASSGAISGTEDLMQQGALSQNVTISSCYTAGANGRVVVSDCSTSVTQQIFWMVNPSRAFFLDSSTSGAEDGTADLQTVSSFSASTFKGQFAMVMDGADGTGASLQGLARVGILQFDGSSKLTLSELANGSFSGPTNPGAMSGNYQVSSNGRIVGSLSNSNGGLDLIMYAISGSEAYALQPDTATNTSGTVELQH
jgi:hypothetical protein